MNHVEQRGFRDRDFLSTEEGFFCIVGPYHPANRVISYLKYSPNPQGRWRRGEEAFERVMQTYTISSLVRTFEILGASSQFVFFSDVYNITMSAVPIETIVAHFKPEVKLAVLRRRHMLDSLQRKTVDLVSAISELSGVSAGNFGVTGSILLDIHNPSFSDMDITVYGFDSCRAVRGGLLGAFSTENPVVQRLSGNRLKKWCRSKARNHPLSLAEAERIHERKWNMGLFQDTFFSVHSIKLERELRESYGDKTYYPAGEVSLRAVVVDSRDSIFLPSVYVVDEVEVEGETAAEIREIVSYEGLYDSLANDGEVIRAKGKLEHVVDHRTGKEYDRVLVGSTEGQGMEYIKPFASL